MKTNTILTLFVLVIIGCGFIVAQEQKDALLQKGQMLLQQSQYQHYKPAPETNPQVVRDLWQKELEKQRASRVRVASLRVNTMPSYSHSTAYANAVVGQSFDVWGNVSSGSGNYSYQWDFGDGNSETGTVTDPRNISVSHIYGAANVYVATLQVWDLADSTSDQDQVTIRVFATPTQQVRVNMAIESGLKFLYLNQYPEGYWDYNTGSCVLAFAENGHKPFNDFDRDIYAETVFKGLHNMLGTASIVGIGPQPAGDPDGNGNGIGVVLVDNSYQQGLDLLGIIACGSRTWGERDTVLYGPLAGRTIFSVVQDVVDDIVWSQTDEGWARGGWRYNVAYSSTSDADNSTVAWLTLGLEAAQNLWGITLPPFVKSELQYWLSYSQDGSGGFGYQGIGWTNLVKTASGIGSYSLMGFNTSHPPVALALDFMNNHWNDTRDNGSCTEMMNGNIYAMWGAAKSFRIANNRQGITHVGTHDWYAEFVYQLLDHPSFKQNSNGSWSASAWHYGHTPTAFAILVLTQSVGLALPVAVIDPTGPFPQGMGFKMNGSHSFHLDPNRTIISYEWDWDVTNGLSWDTGPADAVGPQPYNPGYPGAGIYRVTLRVKDDGVPQFSNTKTFDVAVTDTGHHPPIAIAGPPTGYNAKVGIPILLDGRGSYSPDAALGVTIVGYSWDLNGDGVYGDATTDTVTVVFTEARSILVSLRVYDSRGDSSSNLAEVRVTAAQNNMMVVGFETSPNSLAPGGTISMAAQVTVDETSDISEFSNVYVRFYLGDPFTTGTQIGGTHIISLAKGRIDTVRDMGVVPMSVKVGANRIFVFLDAREAFAEFNEEDNLASTDFFVRPQEVNLEFSSRCLNFATVQNEVRAVQILHIFNATTSNGDVMIDSITITPSLGFSIGEYSTLIPTGEPWELEVYFTPMQPGEVNALMHIYTNNIEQPIYDINLIAVGDLPSTGPGQTIFSGVATFNNLPAPPNSVVEAYRVVHHNEMEHHIFIRSTLVFPMTEGGNYVLSLLEGQGGLANNDIVIFKVIMPNCMGPFVERVCIPPRIAVFHAANPAEYVPNRDILAVSRRDIRTPVLPGYNSISWNVQPLDESVQGVFGGLLNANKVQVVLEYKNDGITNPEYLWYIPPIGRYNPLQKTDWKKGYFIKLFADATPDTFTIGGIPVCPGTPITVRNGYNFISYLPDFPDSTEHVFDVWKTDTNFIAAFDYINTGNDAWFDVYPMGEFRDMVLGKGYIVQRKGPPVDFIYPPFEFDVIESAVPQLAATSMPSKTSMAMEQTSLPMIILVYGTELTLDRQKIPFGSQLRAVAKSGAVCGEAKFAADGIISMAIRADDPLTSDIEGAKVGEQVNLYIDNKLLAQSVVWTKFGDVFELKNLSVTNITDRGLAPKEFALYSCYPNPFNPSTEIRYDVAKPTVVQIKVYNSLGQEVRSLVDQHQNTGSYSVIWDGKNNIGNVMSSGIYIYRMVAGDFAQSYKMILLK